ncbi:neuronal acetylcholine receptor subunit beta-4-like [Lineus longissimus]|uniref:neuronal acetylcholine receptor subunit beta-4-like n=1 Tax=Lineus longissimus TaxID=88925 RepID=UPI002B4DBFDC
MLASIIITLILLSSLIVLEVNSQNVTAEQRLITDLMTGYKKEVRPGNPNIPDGIDETLSLYQIMGLDNRKQTITFSGGLTQVWMDPRLGWDVEKYEFVPFTSVPAEILWRPDVGLFSSVDDFFDIAEQSKNKAIILSNAVVWWNVIKVFTSSCPLDMKYFPFDSQRCEIKFSGATGFTNFIKFTTNGKILLEFFTPNAEWDLINATGRVTELPVYSMEQDGVLPNMSVYTVTLTLQRRTVYYWIHLIIPCMFISGLICFVFVMPADAGEKISFSVTILLAFIVYQLLIADSLPKGSQSVSLLSAYVTALVVLSAMSVIFSIIVLNLYHRDPGVPLPRYFRKIVLYSLGKLVCKKVPVVKPLKKGQVEAWPEKSDANRLSVFVRDQYGTKEDPDVVKSDDLRIDTEERDEVVVNEWKLAAEILDRVFLGVYLIVTAVVNVVILFIMPVWAKQSIEEHQ